MMSTELFLFKYAGLCIAALLYWGLFDLDSIYIFPPPLYIFKQAHTSRERERELENSVVIIYRGLAAAASAFNLKHLIFRTHEPNNRNQ